MSPDEWRSFIAKQVQENAEQDWEDAALTEATLAEALTTYWGDE